MAFNWVLKRTLICVSADSPFYKIDLTSLPLNISPLITCRWRGEDLQFSAYQELCKLMLKYLSMVYKRLWVFGENSKISLSPSWLTRSQSPLLCVGMDVPKCAPGHWTLSRNYNTPEKQVLNSFQNVLFCHPWMSARESNFISISSFSSISSECGLMVWTLIHPLQKMGKKIVALLAVKFVSMLTFILLMFTIKGEWYSCDCVLLSEMKGPGHPGLQQSSSLLSFGAQGNWRPEMGRRPGRFWASLLRTFCVTNPLVFSLTFPMSFLVLNKGTHIYKWKLFVLIVSVTFSE